ncbi:MAG TPA: transposase [Ignavibacteriaceae bacterium]|nr:transposase [Ignavibacteriaceae bacterium]
MIKKTEKNTQKNMFFLRDTLYQRHPLFILVEKINWKMFEGTFGPLYCSDNGRLAMLIRIIVELLILKHLRNISDESVEEQYTKNVTYQYLRGKSEFAAKLSCQSNELVHF